MSNLFYSLSPGACGLALETRPMSPAFFNLTATARAGLQSWSIDACYLQGRVRWPELVSQLGGTPPTLNKYER